jgi:hypothetical protein
MTHPKLEDTLEENRQKADAARKARTSPGRIRGPLFENIAIESNRVKMNIQYTGVHFGCSLCGQPQEVDIIGENQLGEAKSQCLDLTLAKIDEQAPRLLSISRQLYGTKTQPLAKLDKSRVDHPDTAKLWSSFGFDTEIVDSGLDDGKLV